MTEAGQQTVALWQAVVIAVVFPAAAGLWGAWKWLAAWRDGRETAARQITTELLDKLHADLEAARALLDRYRADLEALRAARWALNDAMTDLHAAALAARAMVHELERRLGEPETPFSPLPPWPPPPGPPPLPPS